MRPAKLQLLPSTLSLASLSSPNFDRELMQRVLAAAFLPERFLHFDLRRFNVRTSRSSAATPLPPNVHSPTIVRGIGQDFRFPKGR